MRIGSGSTIDVSPASQQPRIDRDQRAAGRSEHRRRGRRGSGRAPAARRRRPAPRRGSAATKRSTGPVGRHRGADERDTGCRVGGRLEALDRRRRRGATSVTPRRYPPEGSTVRPLAWVTCYVDGNHQFRALARSDASDAAPPFRYNAALAAEIELRWQDRWDDRRTSSRRRTRPAARRPRAAVAAAGEKLFVLDMFPYPSDYGLHVGHPLGLHRHRRLRPLPADGRAQRAVHDGLRRLRPARRAVRRADRPAPGGHHGRERRQLPHASCAAWA